MSQPLPGMHYCLEHQGNHAHYDKRNCDLCKARASWRMVLEEVAEALDVALGDTDITHLEDEELREQHPVQWACAQINQLLQASSQQEKRKR